MQWQQKLFQSGEGQVEAQLQIVYSTADVHFISPTAEATSVLAPGF